MSPRCGPSRLTRLVVLAGALCMLWSPDRASRADETYSEDAVKAVYLYRFAGYVKWPGRPQPSEPFTIDVLGDERIASDLARLLPDHRIDGRPARARNIRTIADLGGAQMLYIGEEFTGDVRAVIAAIAGKPVLVVTDEERGLDDGAVLNFVEADRRVRFEVSLTAATRDGLEISSELLSVAARVQGGRLRSRTDCGRPLLIGEWDSGCSMRVADPASRAARGAAR